MDKLCVSILDVEMHLMSETLDKLKEAGIKNIHLDVIDTSFSSNISFGISSLNYILGFDFNFDIHFMIENPLKIIGKLNLKEGTRITVHSEEYLDIPGYNVGIALNPNKSVEDIKHLFHKISHVLVMGVEPGYGGQEFKYSCLDKIRELKELGIVVGIDGGVNDKTIKEVKNADFIVVGSCIIKSDDISKSIGSLLENIQ